MKVMKWEIWLLFACTILLSMVTRLTFAGNNQDGDVKITQGWMESAVKLGLAPSYDKQISGGIPPTYPPLSLMMFYATGLTYKTFVSPAYEIIQPVHMIYAKMPAFLADVGIVIVLFFLLRTWRRPLEGVLAGIIYSFHPAVLHDSITWGQTDSVFTFAVLFGILLYVRRLPAWGFTVFVAACLLKPQAIAFLPLAFVMLPFKPKPLIGAAVGGIGIVLLSFLSFILNGNVMSGIGVYGVFDLLGETRLSWNAYNLWWMFMGSQAMGIPGGTPILFGISYRTIGLALFGATLMLTCWKLRTRLRSDLFNIENGMAAILAATISAMAFFLLNAEMHERYLFPYLALALPLAFVRIKLSAIYLIVTFCILFNMLAVVPFGAIDAFFFRRIPNFSILLAFAQLTAFYVTLTIAMRYEKEIVPYVRHVQAKSAA